MGGIVNLRRHRKRRARDAARAEADANAARHGEATPVRRFREARDRVEARRLDGHRQDDDGAER